MTNRRHITTALFSCMNVIHYTIIASWSFSVSRSVSVTTCGVIAFAIDSATLNRLAEKSSASRSDKRISKDGKAVSDFISSGLSDPKIRIRSISRNALASGFHRMNRVLTHGG